MADVVKVETNHGRVTHKAVGFGWDEAGYLKIFDADGDVIAVHAPNGWFWVTEGVEDD